MMRLFVKWGRNTRQWEGGGLHPQGLSIPPGEIEDAAREHLGIERHLGRHQGEPYYAGVIELYEALVDSLTVAFTKAFVAAGWAVGGYPTALPTDAEVAASEPVLSAAWDAWIGDRFHARALRFITNLVHGAGGA